MKKLFSSIFLLTTVLFSFNIVWFNPALADNAKAVTYLQTQPLGDWTAMALKAAGQSVDASRLSSISTNASDVTGYLAVEKRILALTSVGSDPTNVGGQNLVAALRGWVRSGQVGDDQSLNDDTWGILALRSVNTPIDDQAISGSKQFLLQNQNADGGWSFGIGGTSDTNSTAITVIALIEAGVPASDQRIANALSYLRAIQNNDGGMPFAAGGASDAASDAWVAWAVRKAGQNPAGWGKNGQTVIGHLRLLQAADGSFNWMSGQAQAPALMTAYALIALSEQTLPLGRVAATGNSQQTTDNQQNAAGQNTGSGTQNTENPPSATTVHVRIEGKDVLICERDVVVANPIAAVEQLAAVCSFSHVISQTATGLYLRQIQNDAASGLRGWLYLVNGVEPTMSAATYQLKLGDELIWYYGVTGMRPLRVRTSAATVGPAEEVNVWVEWQGTDAVWNAVDQAEVVVGSDAYPTTFGQAKFQRSRLGEYTITARKDGYIRPAPAKVTVGEAAQRVALSVDVEAGGSGGGGGGGLANQNSGGGGGGSGGGSVPPVTTPELAFTVNTSQVVIPRLRAGSVGTGQVTLQNTGHKPLHFEDTVSGDSLLVQNVRVGGVPWQSWQVDLNAGASHPVVIDVPVPANASAGTKRGEIVFWATVKR